MVTPLFLLDSSVCVDLLRGRVSSTQLPATSDCFISRIVSAELWAGAEKSGRPTVKVQLEAFLGLFPVLDFNIAAAQHYGDIRAELEKRGTSIGPLDLLIAAHARSLGAVVVTGNTAEFRRVKGLKVVAWK